MNVIAVCFDIEAAGSDVIGIGMAAMDIDSGEVIDSHLCKGWIPGRRIEQRCWDEFWKNHKDVLELLTVENEELTFVQAQKEMTGELLHFLCKIEKLAKSKGCQYHLVSDNKSFDIGLVNRMIETHYDENLQIPTSTIYGEDGKRPYLGHCYETQSMQRAILMREDYEYASKNEWGYGARIRELYGIPEPLVKHDHNPVNDAISQLNEYRDMNLIFNGTY